MNTYKLHIKRKLMILGDDKLCREWNEIKDTATIPEQADFLSKVQWASHDKERRNGDN